VDWHNWTHINAEKARTGPGEHGVKVVVSESDRSADESSFHGNGFSAFASDMISVDRAVPDIRHSG
jgi:polypeptide N-acetylgalactosaminyltransferase